MSFGVTQWVVVSVLLWIATAGSLAAGTYCETSKSIHFAHIWVSNQSFAVPKFLPLTPLQITIIRMISVGLALISIFTFYKRTSTAVKPYGALKQFISFKSLVFLNFLQTVCSPYILNIPVESWLTLSFSSFSTSYEEETTSTHPPTSATMTFLTESLHSYSPLKSLSLAPSSFTLSHGDSIKLATVQPLISDRSNTMVDFLALGHC